MATATSSRRFVTVGVDDTPEAAAAARYAVQKATEGRLDLLVAHAFQRRKVEESATSASLMAEAEAAESLVNTVIAQLIVPPTMRVGRRLACDDPLHLLRRLEDISELVVIGHQGILAGSQPPVGSLVNRLAAHARTPIATVPRVWHPTGHQPVVVAIDGESPASAALSYAFEQAARSGRDLVVVHALTEDYSQEAAAEHEIDIAEILAGWKAGYPDVEVRTVISAREPRELIVDMSVRASEMVVGHPHELPRLPHWYWSMARSVVEASHCPLVVVPAGADVNDRRPDRMMGDGLATVNDRFG
jgi:hypothetical protein